MEQVAAQKETLKQKILDHDAKRRNLLTTIEQLTEKVTKLVSCTEEFQGIRFFFYSCEIQKLSKVFM